MTWSSFVCPPQNHLSIYSSSNGSVFNYEFQNEELFTTAMTHRSFFYEQGTREQNERLEYLGDSVLEFIITEELLVQFPQAQEGVLSKLRSFLVNKNTLALLANSIQLSSSLLLGKGELSQKEVRESILADALEALIGAIYLDAGMEAARSWVLRVYHLHPELWSLDRLKDFDSRTQLQELSMNLFGEHPLYEAIEGHWGQGFFMTVSIKGIPLVSTWNHSKKKAVQSSARLVLEYTIFQRVNYASH